MKTEFEQENANFSDKAHLLAQKIIYPYLFNADYNSLRFVSTSFGTGQKNNILDGEMGVDRMVYVTNRNLSDWLQFAIQERFRRTHYESFRDITITEWNNASNVKSELYKINAGFFVYGYYNEKDDSFGEVVVVDVAGLLLDIAMGSIPLIKRRNKKDQDFLALKIDDLEERGLVLCHFANDEHTPVRVNLQVFKRPRVYRRNSK